MRLLSALFLTLIIFSCGKETPRNINFNPIDQTLLDTSYVDSVNLPPIQNKHILVEEFTGIACPACPGGHQKIEEILSLYGDSVEVIAIHPSHQSFTNPDAHLEFDIDLTTEAGDDIVALYGQFGQLPVAGVDRVDQGGSTYLNNSLGTWIVGVEERFKSNTPVNIEISETIYNSLDKYVKLKVKLHYTSSVVNSQYLSVYLLEDSIIAPQEIFISGWIDDYVHRHILRGMFSSSYQGDELTEDLELGRVFEKEFKLSIDDDWNYDKLHVVAAVHHKVDSNNVVNVRSAHIGH